MFTPPMLEMVAKSKQEDQAREAEKIAWGGERNLLRLRLTLLNGLGLTILILTQLL